MRANTSFEAHAHMTSDPSLSGPLHGQLLTTVTVRYVGYTQRALDISALDHVPPPPGPCFLVFVFPHSLAAFDPPGRPHSEKSISLGPEPLRAEVSLLLAAKLLEQPLQQQS